MLWILLKKRQNKSFNRITYLSILREGSRRLINNFVSNLRQISCWKRNVICQHFKQKTSNSPNIYWIVVSLLLIDLRCHVLWRSSKFLGDHYRVKDLGNAEISQFDNLSTSLIFNKEYVPRLQISVYHSSFVHILNTKHYLNHNFKGLRLFHK